MKGQWTPSRAAVSFLDVHLLDNIADSAYITSPRPSLLQLLPFTTPDGNRIPFLYMLWYTSQNISFIYYALGTRRHCLWRWWRIMPCEIGLTTCINWQVYNMGIWTSADCSSVTPVTIINADRAACILSMLQTVPLMCTFGAAKTYSHTATATGGFQSAVGARMSRCTAASSESLASRSRRKWKMRSSLWPNVEMSWVTNDAFMRHHRAVRLATHSIRCTGIISTITPLFRYYPKSLHSANKYLRNAEED